MTKTTAAKGARQPRPKLFDDPNIQVITEAPGITLLKDSYFTAYAPLPLPGIVILVHGVNSDGEWYEQTEQGLCDGLNKRLKRLDEQMAFPTPQGGQLTPAKYKAELTDDGFINPDRQPDTFIEESEHCSPVIRFRWGYKASSKELQTYGEGIYLNEQNYWGGGPFANGCTSLPDLWSEGLSQSLFLWWSVENVNPVKDRPVFSCPPRPYFVLAALRLAKLIESIRKLQANVPITIVCHSQGNMVSMAAAFLGDGTRTEDGTGMSARCVADSYVLCNPPYSLQKAKFIENWTESHMTDRHGGSGRQTADARIATMRAFFDIIRTPASTPQEVDDINQAMANKKHQFDAGEDRQAYGYGPKKQTCGRVTLYCNPHDQVISATTIRGIGWLGMSDKEIAATGGADVFSQRVFAQDFEIGTGDKYHYWNNHYQKLKAGDSDFWMPRSPPAKYSLSATQSGNAVGTVLNFLTAPLSILLMAVCRIPINALPEKDWCIPLKAPKLPEPFKPAGLRFGKQCTFDEGRTAPGEQRDPNRQRHADDPYAGEHKIEQKKHEPERPATDAGRGDKHSEAQLRYEHHARLRMTARREGLVKKEDEHVAAEDEPTRASGEYKKWRSEKIGRYLEENVDNNASDHSTTMTNPKHARLALAYDVAVGVCDIKKDDMHELRVAADWRLLLGLEKENPHRVFVSYFDNGTFAGGTLKKWIQAEGSAGAMPAKIDDRREYASHQKTNEGSQHD